MYFYLSDFEKERFTKALTAAISIPFIDDIEDFIVESIWAHAKGLENIDPLFNIRSKRLYDVVDTSNRIGWSVKSVQWAFRPGCDFELVIQRAAIIKKATALGFSGLSLDNDPQMLGSALLKHWKLKVEGDAVAQNVDDKRTMILLKTADKTRYAILEESLKLYTENEIQWQWSSQDRNGLQGIRISDEKCVYRWYPSQTQFFERFHLPADAYIFNLAPKRLEISQVVDMLNTYLQERQ
jgi:hypothetical protein